MNSLTSTALTGYSWILLHKMRQDVRKCICLSYQLCRVFSGFALDNPRGAGHRRMFVRGHPAFFRAGNAARRTPMLLLRLPGSFLLRLADWQLAALLFQLPPRFTRLVPLGGAPILSKQIFETLLCSHERYVLPKHRIEHQNSPGLSHPQ